MLVAAWRLDDAESASVLVPREEVVVEIDVLAYDESEGEEVERRAAFGLSQPLYAKSPGVTATARRTESYRPLVEDAVAGSGFDADLVEAIVFRKRRTSGRDRRRRPGRGVRPDPDPGRNGTELPRDGHRPGCEPQTDSENRGRRARGDTMAPSVSARFGTVDTRFDPEQALAGTVRYLAVARNGSAATTWPSSRTTWGSGT